MLPITPMLLTNRNRPRKKLIKLKGIVIHWTANTNRGANALANRNYFNSTNVSASAHYVVDDRQIIQCIPDDEVAWHVGAKKYTSLGETLRQIPYSPNYFLLGIEMCVNSDGDWGKTYRNTVELVAQLIRQHKLTLQQVYRHYDITGKECPKMMIAECEWRKFLQAVQDELNKIRIEVNGKILDVSGITLNGCTYAPIRAVCEAMGATVDWEQETKTVKIRG